MDTVATVRSATTVIGVWFFCDASLRDPVFGCRSCGGGGGVVSDEGSGADVSAAQRAYIEIRGLVHSAQGTGTGFEVGDLYRLAGDLARLAHACGEAVGLLADGLETVGESGRVHLDETRRAVPAVPVDETARRLQRARDACGAAGDALDGAHNDLAHFSVTDPVLRVVPEPESDSDSDRPVGEQR